MGIRQRLQPLRARFLFLLAVIGPGIITTNVDNDAGGITTYSVAGAHYGYKLLWMLPLVGLALIFAQEMSARLGVITGKGLADLIREKYGVRWTAVIISVMVFTNLANTVSEFAGIAASMQIFGVSKYISVPVAAVGLWLLVVKASYKVVERVLLLGSLFYMAYVGSALLTRPPWAEVARAALTPSFQFDPAYIVLLVTIVGTTVAPWQQFYQQSSIVDKGMHPADYPYELIDVLVGVLYALLVVALVIVTCAATLFAGGVRIETARDAAIALHPLAGPNASRLFAFGLLNASVMAAAILPLSTAYVVCEAFGWESGVSQRLEDAPAFFGIHAALLLLGAGIVLLPIRSLVQAMMASQTLNGVVLPVILVAMLQLVSDKKLLGRYANRPAMNVLAWIMVAALVALNLILLIVAVFPGFFGS
jgi:Mn2+/Fe2+ NRAMP family transporter